MKRCKHEIEIKDGYPDDLLCHKCQHIWHISSYMDWSAFKLMHHAPPFIRQAVLKRQADDFTYWDDLPKVP